MSMIATEREILKQLKLNNESLTNQVLELEKQLKKKKVLIQKKNKELRDLRFESEAQQYR